MRLRDDLKSSIVLSASFAIAAALTVPLLLPSLPAIARELPLPVWAFCLVLAVQLTIVYGLIAIAGCRIARSTGHEPAPLLSAFWKHTLRSPSLRALIVPVVAGLACGAVVVFVVSLIQRLLPGTLPATLHPPGILAALAASGAGSIGEEILFRLFCLSLLVRVMAGKSFGRAAAVSASALLYGIAHAPAMVFLFGGIDNVPLVSWLWLMGLNGICGVVFGMVYLRRGVEAAILTHFATDVVWHGVSQLLR